MHPENEPLLKVASIATQMTHVECVAHAASYLSKRCNVVLPEFYTHNAELPDVIGFKKFEHDYSKAVNNL